MEKTDVILFAGQSNMQGETEGVPFDNSPIEGAKEYRFLSDSLIELKHPVGEDIQNGLLCAAKDGCGTLLPYFCDEYVKNSKNRVVAVHMAKGATTISQWLKGSERYQCVLEKGKAAIKKAKEEGKIENIFLVWLQGESDAVIGTSQKSYQMMLEAFKNDLMHDLEISKFCIIKIGYFCRVAPWLEYSKNGEGKPRDEEIMKAQKQVCENDNDFLMLTEICETISMNAEYMNPYVGGHFNNKGMCLIGKTAGKRLADYEKSNR